MCVRKLRFHLLPGFMAERHICGIDSMVADQGGGEMRLQTLDEHHALGIKNALQGQNPEFR